MTNYAPGPADRKSVYWLEQSHSDVPADNAWLSPAELETFSRLRFPKRREDWLLGRWTAKTCLAAYARKFDVPSDFSRIEIRSQSSGAPFGVLLDQNTCVSISLTHRAGKAMCAFAPSNLSVGCDLELVEERSPEFLSDYFTQEEQLLVERTSIQERALMVNMLWSVKESALKAMCLGLRVDTKAVNVLPFTPMDDVWIDAHPISLSAVPRHTTLPKWQCVQVTVEGGTIFQGWWSVSEPFVRTVALGYPFSPESDS